MSKLNQMRTVTLFTSHRVNFVALTTEESLFHYLDGSCLSLEKGNILSFLILQRTSKAINTKYFKLIQIYNQSLYFIKRGF
jgi:hypothetical protein